MSPMERTLDRDQLFRYLLGQLPDQEMELLEERFFVDSDCFAQVNSAEEDLVDLYVLGRLPAAQKNLFEQNYLAQGSPIRQRRVAFAKTFLRQVASNAAPEKQVGVWERFWASFAISWAPRLAVAGLAATLFLAGWLTYSHLKEERLEMQLAEEKQRTLRLQQELEKAKHLQAPTPPGMIEAKEPFIVAQVPIAELTLQGDIARSEGKMPSVRLERTQPLRLRLVTGEGSWVRYIASLQNADARMLLQPQVTRVKNGVVELSVPAGLAPPGAYVVQLEGAVKGGELEVIGEFSFQVTR